MYVGLLNFFSLLTILNTKVSNPWARPWATGQVLTVGRVFQSLAVAMPNLLYLM